MPGDWWPRTESNGHVPLGTTDFKSVASTNSATGPAGLNVGLSPGLRQAKPGGGGPGGGSTTQPPNNLTANAANQGGGKVRLHWDNDNQGGVVIDWGDGLPAESSGSSSGVLTHQYTKGGNYTITVTDADDPTRKTTVNVTVNLP